MSSARKKISFARNDLYQPDVKETADFRTRLDCRTVMSK